MRLQPRPFLLDVLLRTKWLTRRSLPKSNLEACSLPKITRIQRLRAEVELGTVVVAKLGTGTRADFATCWALQFCGASGEHLRTRGPRQPLNVAARKRQQGDHQTSKHTISFQHTYPDRCTFIRKSSKTYVRRRPETVAHVRRSSKLFEHVRQPLELPW